MDLHRFNMKGLFDGKEHYGHLTFAYGSFELDRKFDTRYAYEREVWCSENCCGEYAFIPTYASYVGEGIRDVAVIAFKEESDAVAFKLMWA